MAGRVWVGFAVTVAAVTGLGGYFAVVGLDEADKLASVLGLFIAVAGLAVAVWGLFSDRRSGGQGQAPPETASALGERSAAVGRGNSGIVSTGDTASNVQLRAAASGQGRVFQAGRDQNITER